MPPVLADELEKEEMNLIKVSLMDYVNTAALEFISGKRDLDKDWDAYVADCESKGSTKYVDQANEIFERYIRLLRKSNTQSKGLPHKNQENLRVMRGPLSVYGRM